MNNYITIVIWIQSCIESCKNTEQLENSLNLIQLFYKRFEHPLLYTHLISIYSEHKTYLNHEKIN